MDIEKLTTLQPKDFGNWVDPSRPILSTRYFADGPHRISPHQHPRAQVLYPMDGVYRINTPLGNWAIPPGHAIWIPSHVHHEVYANCSINSFIFFVDELFTGSLPKQCMVVNVKPLLYELFSRAIELGNDYEPGSRKSRFFDVFLDELNDIEPAPLHLPLAKDKRVKRVMDILLENPADKRSLDELALLTGASIRTLERLFKKETALTFHEWRGILRLQEAVERLAQGYSITDIAMDLGYQSPSAFIAMFKRIMGVPPGKYIRQEGSAGRASQWLGQIALEHL